MYRMLDCGTWDDPWFAELDPDAKLLFLYLITNRRSTSCGAFEITIRAMAFETGVSSERIARLLTEYGDRARWWPEHQIVWLRNFYKHQTINKAMRLNARRTVSRLPEDIRRAIGDVYPELSSGQDTPQEGSGRGLGPIDRLSANESHKKRGVSRGIHTPSGQTGTGVPSRATVVVDDVVVEREETTTTATTPPVRAREEPPPSGKATYADVLNGSLPPLLALFQKIDKQFTDGWVRTVLVEAESQVGPLPRDKLVSGLDLAVDQIRRKVDAGKVNSPRMFARTLIVTYLKEQQDGRPAA